MQKTSISGGSPWSRIGVGMTSADVRPLTVKRDNQIEDKHYIFITDATSSSPSEAKNMSDPTREEIDAKIEASEARVEARLTAIDGKLDRLFDRLQVAISQTGDAKDAALAAQKAASSTKWNILFTALASIAALLAVWALWVQAAEMVATLLSAKGG